ncbi:hypothetical protein [Micromonospora sp. NPDC005652]|uniref:hypothetical protein n=1 Tax=Micromonospora sp. NPDC005652 TaxID=3157046 RepID=UPI00340EFA55
MAALIIIAVFAAVVTKAARTWRDDQEYAKQGQEPPRYKLYHRLLDMAEKRQGKGSGSGRRSGPPARPGARGYFKDLWFDSWDDLGEYRRKLREQNKTNPRMTQKQQLAAIQAWAKQSLNRRKDGTPVDEKPLDDMVDVAGVRPTSAPEAPAADPWKGTDEPTVEITPEPAPKPAEEPVKEPVTEPAEKPADAEPAPQEKTNPAVPATEGERPLAPVIPLFPNPKEIDMSNAEVTGLPTAVAFAKGMAAAHQAAATAGGEQYVAALHNFDVGDEDIAKVATARDLSAQAAAAWEGAATAIEKHRQVAEAYQAVPTAGNKKFVTGE